MRRITLKQTLVATAAAFVLAGTPAVAAPYQDLRGEQAQEAARLAAPHQDLRGEHAQDAARLAAQPHGEHVGRTTTVPPTGRPPVYWSYNYEAGKPSPRHVSAPASKPTGDDSDVWLVLGIALAATGIVAGSAVAVSRRTRVRAAA